MISIIVPVYKVELYLGQCVDSILAQTYREIEVLLIDDGSPDKCGEMCDAYASKDPRVKVFHTENGGLSAARNEGLKHATGDYIAFVDSDDWIDPDMYEVLLKDLLENGSDVSFCGFWNDFPNTTTETAFEKRVLQGNEIIESMVAAKINNHVWNKLYRRRIFEELEFPVGMLYEDAMILPRILSRCNKVSVVPGSKYHYRQREDSVTKTYTSRQLLDYAEAYFSRNEFVKNTYPDLMDTIGGGILQSNANGVARVWRWWHGCNKEEKYNNGHRILVMRNYIRANVPLFGVHSWPTYLRIASFFMHSESKLSFVAIYYLNQMYRKAKGTEM